MKTYLLINRNTEIGELQVITEAPTKQLARRKFIRHLMDMMDSDSPDDRLEAQDVIDNDDATVFINIEELRRIP